MVSETGKKGSSDRGEEQEAAKRALEEGPVGVGETSASTKRPLQVCFTTFTCVFASVHLEIVLRKEVILES